MEHTNLLGNKATADQKIDERLKGGSWLPPQGHPSGVTGAPSFDPDNAYSFTSHAVGTGLGNRIRGFRGLYDMSLGSLAAQMNVPEDMVAAWESAKEPPTVLQLCLMCDVFKTTPNALLMGPYYVQAGPLDGLGQHLETLPNEAQLAILFIARICRRNEGKKPPESPYL
jgi:transcriptional regulator with XRE-family HTH domain